MATDTTSVLVLDSIALIHMGISLQTASTPFIDDKAPSVKYQHPIAAATGTSRTLPVGKLILLCIDSHFIDSSIPGLEFHGAAIQIQLPVFGFPLVWFGVFGMESARVFLVTVLIFCPIRRRMATNQRTGFVLAQVQQHSPRFITQQYRLCAHSYCMGKHQPLGNTNRLRSW